MMAGMRLVFPFLQLFRVFIFLPPPFRWQKKMVLPSPFRRHAYLQNRNVHAYPVYPVPAAGRNRQLRKIHSVHPQNFLSSRGGISSSHGKITKKYSPSSIFSLEKCPFRLKKQRQFECRTAPLKQPHPAGRSS